MSEGTSSQQVTMEKGLKILLSCHENMQYNLHTLTRDQEKKKKKTKELHQNQDGTSMI